MGAYGAHTGSGALAVLELLAEEASPERYAQLLYQARKSGASRSELGLLERAVDLAADLRTPSVRVGRREAGMAALLDVALETASPLSADQLLDIVNSRARRLLTLDMACAGLRRTGGGSCIDASDGHTTLLDAGLVVPQDSGLGGMVQAKQAPFWTADYLADDRFAHADLIDEVVRAEGLHAVLAVPLRHGNTVIGTLYGADRHVRHFTPDEIWLMRSLADLAAVALDRARQLQGSRSELLRRTSETSRAEARLARTRSLTTTGGDLFRLALGGGGLDTVTRTAAEALARPLVVRDPGGSVLSSTEALEEKHHADVPSAQALFAGSGVRATSVTAGAEELGVLETRSEPPPADEDEEFLVLVAQAVALVLLRQRSTALAERPLRDGLFDDLLDPSQPARQLAERARRLDMDPDGPYVVAAVRPEGGEHGRAVAWTSSYAYRKSGLKTVHDGCIFLLLPGRDASAAARAVSGELSPLLGHPVSVGAAGPADGLFSVARVRREAVRCLDALTALDGAGSAASSADLGFLGLLLADEHDVGGFIATTIGPVLDYDTQRSSDLTRTLHEYFGAGSSPTYAAEALHVHPNTVSRRLERITELLGPDWQAPAAALEIQLALRLERARDALCRRRDAARDGVPQAERAGA